MGLIPVTLTLPFPSRNMSLEEIKVMHERETKEQVDKYCERHNVSLTSGLLTKLPSSSDILEGDAGGGMTVMDACISRISAKFDKAALDSDYDSWVYTAPEIGKNNGFFASAQDCREWCVDYDVEPPEFAFCCDGEPPQFLDYDDLVQEMVFVDSFEEAWEQVGQEAESDFRNAIDKFNEHISKILSYSPDFNRKVRVKPL